MPIIEFSSEQKNRLHNFLIKRLDPRYWHAMTGKAFKYEITLFDYISIKIHGTKDGQYGNLKLTSMMNGHEYTIISFTTPETRVLYNQVRNHYQNKRERDLNRIKTKILEKVNKGIYERD